MREIPVFEGFSTDLTDIGRECRPIGKLYLSKGYAHDLAYLFHEILSPMSLSFIVKGEKERDSIEIESAHFMGFDPAKAAIDSVDKEKTMETLVNEVFEKIVDSVANILFDDKTNDVHRNLVRGALIQDNILDELKRLADDTEIRSGTKT